VAPVLGTTIKFIDGQTGEGVASVFSDISLIIGLGAFAKVRAAGQLSRNWKIAVGVATVIDTGLAGRSTLKGIDSLQQGQDWAAAAQFGEAGLRLVGISAGMVAFWRSEANAARLVAEGQAAGAPKANLRQLYTDEVAGLEKVGKDLLAAGRSEAEVAKTLHQMRRDLGVKYKDMTPPDLLEYIYKFNEARYGDKLGPTLELLKQQGKTDAQIIGGASRPLGDMKQLGAALHKQFGDEIAPILRKYGMLD
jgi:hypothetical protein